MNIRLAREIQPDSIVDGEGLRTVIWTQGCSHNCLGCHNPSTHDFNGGFLKDVEELKNEKILILTDMFGGTPSNIVAANLKNHDFKCISGMNLPMLLDALMLRESEPLEIEQLAEQCLKTGKEGIIDIEKMISEKK